MSDLGDPRPLVAPPRAAVGLGLILGGAGLLGLVAFLLLSNARGPHGPAPEASSPPAAAIETGVANPPPEIAAEQAAARGGVPPVVQAVPVPAVVMPLKPPPAVDGAVDEGFRAPSLVVDLSGAGAPPAAAAAPAAPPSGLNGQEQFAHRVEGVEVEHASAGMLRHQSTLIAQGAIMTGVLETALDSDLPGFARAVVSRDVRGFDGSKVLIPRGSHVIGQYQSAVAQGQTRAFVIWTRIIWPDGASIQIGSPGTDTLGRAGLQGSVNTHFLERFSGAILLSVIYAGITSLARQPTTQVVIGSSQEAVNTGLSALVPTAIPPTIKVRQGAPIRIFVARDLDFQAVQGVAPQGVAP